MFFRKKNLWSVSFPNEPLSAKKIKRKITNLKNDLDNFRQKNSPAYLLKYPPRIAIEIWKKIIPFNPNNLGNWSINSKEKVYGTQLFEQKLIKQMINLYQGNSNDLEGYITSGGTEGNIFSAWIGRKYLEQKLDSNQICLIKNSLTHYSITKAADIINVKSFDVGINSKNWSLDHQSLKKEISQLYKKNYRGFLISLTLGYTLTGTNDDIESIIKIIRELKKQYLDIKFYCWIDASLSGLSIPFTQKSFAPFTYPEIFSIVVDFHKLVGAPLPSGLIIYRKKLRKLIEKVINYLPQKDNTLLGSRSGIAPVASWALINSLGRKGLVKMIKKHLQEKKKFINKYSQQSGIKFITSPNSLGAGIMLNSTINHHKKYFAENYDLHFKKVNIKFSNYQKKVTISKLFFLGQQNENRLT